MYETIIRCGSIEDAAAALAAEGLAPPTDLLVFDPKGMMDAERVGRLLGTTVCELCHVAIYGPGSEAVHDLVDDFIEEHRSRFELGEDDVILTFWSEKPDSIDDEVRDLERASPAPSAIILSIE